MPRLVNQCLLSQSDFDFLTKTNLIDDLSFNLMLAQSSMSESVLFGYISGALIFLLVVFAIIIRSQVKMASNILIAMTFVATVFMSWMIYSDYSEVQELNAKIAVLNKDLKSITKPDVEIFYACAQPNGVLHLADDRDNLGFKSTYTPAVSLD
ncbi:MAG: hypothetical protein J6N72_06630 [Psychrobacter sp.]|nr:hypothetical protein [Psychrobacter sp.]